MHVGILLPLLVRLATSSCCWCDSDTVESARTVQDSDGKTYNLVFSDEFNALSRNFSNGQDPKWTALDAPHFSMVYFQSSQITTVADEERNVLRVRSTKQKMGNKTYISGMLQGWNKFCFTGGIVEFSVKFPASPGYWPAVWMFGNLGRAVYEDSCTDVWPWTYDVCSKELQDSLPPNQRQKIQTCNDNPGDGLNPNQGRGAPEIDIVEGWGGESPPQGNVMQNFQIAPRLPRYFWPRNGNPPSGSSGGGSWYRGLKFGDGVNPGQWYGHQDEGCNPGTCPDVLGCSIWSTTMGSQYHTVRLEWKVGSEGYMKWYWGDLLTMHIPAKSLTRDYVDPGGAPSEPRQIPNEPMYLMANIALSDHFAGGQKAVKIDPGDLMVDWIRVYQDPEQINTGCDPSDYPTKDYIAAHQSLYGPPASPMESCPPERHGLPPTVTAVAVGQQSACDVKTNLYSQQLSVSFVNFTTQGGTLIVDSKSIVVSGTSMSPLTITLADLVADGMSVNISAHFDGSSNVLAASFVAPASCALAPSSPPSTPTASDPPTSPSSLSSAPSMHSPSLPISPPSSRGAAIGDSDVIGSWSTAMSIGVFVVTAVLLAMAGAGIYYGLYCRKSRPAPISLNTQVYSQLE